MSSVRAKVTIRGAVQGVGFRPFVYRLAAELRLTGWVVNSAQGLFVEAEGERPRIEHFLRRVEREKPTHASIQSFECSILDPIGYDGFEIRESSLQGDKTALILPDIATCEECMREVLDPHDRRYLYPFTNCTNCGPRFSIIDRLPYDRMNTSMTNFAMCDRCRREYDNPQDRRFHAQPNACPRCGPHLELWDNTGQVLASNHKALMSAAESIRAGEILAFKGLGGFLLVADARNAETLKRLRVRKHREERPFALLFPTLEMVHRACEVSWQEERLLRSPESPIVLLRRRVQPPSDISFAVAPRNPLLGVMLPYTPLHHLLMRELDFPVVATSGNISDEPICIDEQEALVRLRGIADAFLVHDRPIVRQIDDSITRCVAGREQVLRRARGYAPLPLQIKENADAPMLAVGAHLKNAVALRVKNNVFISQHIGDLETHEAHEAFRKITADLLRMYDVASPPVVSDLHPEYLSTKYAARIGENPTTVQHHYAHIAACMGENDLDAPVLGVSWDGTGYGTDGTIWGGEFLLVKDRTFERIAHLRTFRLPGAEASIKEPRRTALGVLHEVFGDTTFDDLPLTMTSAFSLQELSLIRRMLERKVNSPVTSSAGRLFDAVASIIGLRHRSSFEGQAAMELEFATDGAHTDATYDYRLHNSQNGYPLVLDWAPMVLGVIADLRDGTPKGDVAAKVHNTLAQMIVAVAKHIGERKVALSGGCFQNKYLTERAVRQLAENGFQPYWHQRVPPNDGGIAFGQIVAATRSSQTRLLHEQPRVDIPVS